MTETHGSSPIYDNFPESVKTLSYDQGGILLGILTEEDFSEEKWTAEEIKNWINRTAKPQLREAVVKMIYFHCSADALKPHLNLIPLPPPTSWRSRACRMSSETSRSLWPRTNRRRKCSKNIHRCFLGRGKKNYAT
jgi:hypothetical protein